MKKYALLASLLFILTVPFTYANTIAVFFAMDSEANYFLASKNISSCDDLLDSRLLLSCFSFKESNKQIYVVTNKTNKKGVARVATQPAAVAAWEIITKLKPDWIINAGTAGGFQEKGAKIGTVYLCDKYAAYHDRRIPYGDNWINYGKGYFPCEDLGNMAHHIGVKKGNISTGNSLDLSPTDEIQIAKLDVSGKDMEAAAVADIAQLSGVKFTAIKSITDIVDKNANTHEDFNKNFDFATRKLADKTNLLIQKI